MVTGAVGVLKVVSSRDRWACGRRWETAGGPRARRTAAVRGVVVGRSSSGRRLVVERSLGGGAGPVVLGDGDRAAGAQLGGEAHIGEPWRGYGAQEDSHQAVLVVLLEDLRHGHDALAGAAAAVPFDVHVHRGHPFLVWHRILRAVPPPLSSSN